MTALLIFAGFLLVAACVVVFMNRTSPTVVQAAVTAVITLVSALGVVFAANRPSPITRTFPVIFAVEKSSLLPIVIPDRPFPLGSLSLPDELKQLDPKTFQISSSPDPFHFVGLLYHEYLQKMFVDDLAEKHIGSWRMRIERFVDQIQWSPMPDASSYPSRILSVQELEQAFAQNRFARVHSGFGKWALPPETKLRIAAPKEDPRLGEVGTIQLTSGLCEISIQTVFSHQGVGFGKYTPLVDMSIADAQQNYWTIQYMARIDVSFPWYRFGDPDMAAYRDWANAIVEELSFSFDEESLWNRTKDNFILNRHLDAQTQRMKIPLGPIRMSTASLPKETQPKTDGK